MDKTVWPLPVSGSQQADQLLWARISAGLFCLELILFAVVRLLFIDRYSLGGSELFALVGARMALTDLLAYAVADIVHPPLFYILLKVWIALGGEALVWLKLLAVLSGSAIIVPFLLICRTLKLGSATRNLALLFLASNGYLIHYTQELRMYGLCASLALLSLWLVWRYWETPTVFNRHLLALFVTNLALIYTHYYGWLVVGLEFLFLALWQRQKLSGYAGCLLLLGLCFSPWVYLVVKETNHIGGLARNLDWIPRPALSRLASLYADFNGQPVLGLVNGLGLVLFGYPVLVMAWASLPSGWQAVRAQIKRSIGKATAFWMLLLTAFLPSIGLFLVSQRTAVAFWMDRYFVFIAVPYMVLVAIAINQLRIGWLRRLTILAVVVWSFWAGARDLATNRMAWQGTQLGTRLHWASLARQLSTSEESPSNDISVYTLPVYSEGQLAGSWVIANSLPFYLATIPDERFRFVYARDVNAMLSQLDRTHFWVAFFDLGNGFSASVERALIQSGYRLGKPIMESQGNSQLMLIPVWQD